MSIHATVISYGGFSSQALSLTQEAEVTLGSFGITLLYDIGKRFTFADCDQDCYYYSKHMHISGTRQ